MPKTNTNEVYKFEELSEEAKEKAISDNYEINLYHGWWHYVYDDTKEISALLGIDIRRIWFTGFSNQGDGACFEGSYSYRAGSLKAVQEHAPYDSELHQIARDLIAVQRPAFYQLSASTKQRGIYMHSGCMSVDVYPSDSVTEDQEDGVTECLRDFANWIYSRLESEYEHLTSDFAIAESIMAYDFLLNGETC